MVAAPSPCSSCFVSLGTAKAQPQRWFRGLVPPPHAAPAPRPGSPASHHPLRGACPHDSSPGEAQTNTIFLGGFIAKPIRLSSTTNSGFIPMTDEARAPALANPSTAEEQGWRMDLGNRSQTCCSRRRDTHLQNPLISPPRPPLRPFTLSYTPHIPPCLPARQQKRQHSWMFSSSPSLGHPETPCQSGTAAIAPQKGGLEARATPCHEGRQSAPLRACSFNHHHSVSSLVHAVESFGGREGQNEN